jgi:hypothetical protein
MGRDRRIVVSAWESFSSSSSGKARLEGSRFGSLAKDPVTFFPLRGRPKYRVKQAAPGNDPARDRSVGTLRE